MTDTKSRELLKTEFLWLPQAPPAMKTVKVRVVQMLISQRAESLDASGMDNSREALIFMLGILHKYICIFIYTHRHKHTSIYILYAYLSFYLMLTMIL
jgi:hypothetical protein